LDLSLTGGAQGVEPAIAGIEAAKKTCARSIFPLDGWEAILVETASL
jgi:hypothetical protein